MRKLDQLVSYAQELGISIRATRAGNVMVDDGDKSFYLEDIESNERAVGTMMPFPPMTEYKLTYFEDTNI